MQRHIYYLAFTKIAKSKCSRRREDRKKAPENRGNRSIYNCINVSMKFSSRAMLHKRNTNRQAFSHWYSEFIHGSTYIRVHIIYGSLSDSRSLTAKLILTLPTDPEKLFELHVTKIQHLSLNFVTLKNYKFFSRGFLGQSIYRTCWKIDFPFSSALRFWILFLQFNNELFCSPKSILIV